MLQDPVIKKKYLTRCPKCGFENYSLNVALGICTWCGFDINNPNLETQQLVESQQDA